MRNRFYESLNHGFNNMIKSAMKESILNEKKVELSDEDKADDALIASAIDRKYRNNGAMTKEEKDALKRHGYKLNGKRFVSPNGYIDANWSSGNVKTNTKQGYSTPRLKQEKTSKCINPDANWYDRKYEPVTYEKNFSPVNFSRRQKERLNNRIPVVGNPEYSWHDDDLSRETKKWFKPERGAKKRYGGKNELVPGRGFYGRATGELKEVPKGLNSNGNFENRLDAERYEQNARLQHNVNYLKSVLKDRKNLSDRRAGVFDTTEKDRQNYIENIAYYKQLLKELEDRENEQLAKYDAEINSKTDSIRDFLDRKKKK